MRGSQIIDRLYLVPVLTRFLLKLQNERRNRTVNLLADNNRVGDNNVRYTLCLFVFAGLWLYRLLLLGRVDMYLCVKRKTLWLRTGNAIPFLAP
jgi:hypothetical protein